MEVALLAKVIAKAEGADKKAVEDCFTAGLLHDAGILVLATNFSSEYGPIFSSAKDAEELVRAECEAFGASHAEVGGYLMGIWGLPDPIIEALTFHHCVDEWVERTFSPLIAVHVADSLAYELEGEDVKLPRAVLKEEFMKEIGLAERLEEWRAVCEKTVFEKLRNHDRELERQSSSGGR